MLIAGIVSPSGIQSTGAEWTRSTPKPPRLDLDLSYIQSKCKIWYRLWQQYVIFLLFSILHQNPNELSSHPVQDWLILGLARVRVRWRRTQTRKIFPKIRNFFSFVGYGWNERKIIESHIPPTRKRFQFKKARTEKGSGRQTRTRVVKVTLTRNQPVTKKFRDGKAQARARPNLQKRRKRTLSLGLKNTVLPWYKAVMINSQILGMSNLWCLYASALISERLK